jgi:endonuclease/exonuclease/phosphatase family metal-dependent hydrolase
MRLRVLTYNVHKCVGALDRRYDPERIAEVVAHEAPDVVLLQEVARKSPRFRGECQMERLTELLGYPHGAYVVNVKKFGNGGEYGNAILSRHRLEEVENLDLRIPPKKARAALHARVHVDLPQGASRTLHVFSLHLGLSGIERAMQVDRFLASARLARIESRTPTIVAGDFNDWLGSLSRRFVAADFRGVRRPQATYPSYAPLRPLDGVWVRGDVEFVQCARSRLELARSASDHLPVVADLELAPVAAGRSS